MISPEVLNTAHKCSTISFYYHMYGDDIGSLNLYLVHDPPPYQLDNPVWGLVGNQGNKWIKGELNITFPRNIKVSFLNLFFCVLVKINLVCVLFKLGLISRNN